MYIYIHWYILPLLLIIYIHSLVYILPLLRNVHIHPLVYILPLLRIYTSTATKCTYTSTGIYTSTTTKCTYSSGSIYQWYTHVNIYLLCHWYILPLLLIVYIYPLVLHTQETPSPRGNAHAPTRNPSPTQPRYFQTYAHQQWPSARY